MKHFIYMKKAVSSEELGEEEPPREKADGIKPKATSKEHPKHPKYNKNGEKKEKTAKKGTDNAVR